MRIRHGRAGFWFRNWGTKLIVAHARNVRLRFIGEELTEGDDRLDAQALARLARIDPQLLSRFNIAVLRRRQIYR